MTTTWYYDYYEKGAFTHQQDLCKAVAWTDCNLEGQRVVPTTSWQQLPNGTGKQYQTISLTGEPANPLTIRLLATQEAINKLETTVNTIKEAIEKQSQKEFSKGKIFGMDVKFGAQGSFIETGGAPVLTIKIQGKREPLPFRYDIAHLSLYEFFTNFGSALERLTYEIDRLYSLTIPLIRRYWGTLTNVKHKHLAKLAGKNNSLADLLKSYAGKFEMATRYRNRMVHDGVIRVGADFSLLKSSVMLAEDPNDDESPMNVDAIEFCKDTKSNLIRLLDKSYEIMLQHHKIHGNPPW
jgi:hypothetical protein